MSMVSILDPALPKFYTKILSMSVFEVPVMRVGLNITNIKDFELIEQ